MNLLTQEKYPQFTRKEERRLAEQVVAGREAREKLVQSQIPWMLNCVKRYKPPGMDREELEAEAMRCLVIAVDRFDPAKGRLTTFARWYARKAVQTVAIAIRRASPPGDRVSPDTLESPEDRQYTMEAEAAAACEARILEVIEKRFGPRDCHLCWLRLRGLTYLAISKELGITKSRVGQIWPRLRGFLGNLLDEDGEVRSL